MLEAVFCFIGNVLPYETECSAGKKYPLTGPESAPLLLEKKKKGEQYYEKESIGSNLRSSNDSKPCGVRIFRERLFRI